jgi:transcriptional regulator with XRE-family HTH domain
VGIDSVPSRWRIKMTIREYRKKHGYTVRAFAKILGCSHQLIGLYETKRQPVSSIMKHLLTLVSNGEITEF